MVVAHTNVADSVVSAGAEKRRAFLALWPGPVERPVLAQLAAVCAARFGGKAVAESNVHLTLVFLGDLRSSQIKAVEELATGVPVAPFTLVLDRLGFWPRKRIVWAGCGHTPNALSELVGRLREGLRRLGFRVDARPYVQHLTLVRKAHRAPRLKMATLKWPIDGFCLVCSTLSATGAHYDVVHRWTRC